MEQLLKQEIDALLKARNARNQSIGPFPTARLSWFEAREAAFDLTDAKSSDNPKVARGTGTVTYINANGYDLHFVDYDIYLSTFDQSRYSRNLGRCDYLAYDVDGRSDYFLLNELCEGALQNKKQKGINQLAATLHFLRESDTLKAAMDTRAHRLCFLSVKEKAISSPQRMADAFNNPMRIIPPIYRLDDRRISREGFEAYATCRITLDGNVINARPLPKK